MPRSLDPGTYPETFWKLLEALPLLPTGARFTFASRGQARDFRHEWYTFLNSLRAAAKAAPKGSTDGQRYAALATQGRSYIASMTPIVDPAKPDSWLIYIYPKSMKPSTVAVADQLAAMLASTGVGLTPPAPQGHSFQPGRSPEESLAMLLQQAQLRFLKPEQVIIPDEVLLITDLPFVHAGTGGLFPILEQGAPPDRVYLHEGEVILECSRLDARA